MHNKNCTSAALLFLLIINSPILSAEEITVAFWNVENLFDGFRDKRTPHEDLFIPSELREKLRKDGEIIRELDADVLGLMEVENHGVLKELIDAELSEMGYKYHALIDVENERGIDVALVSRYPFLCYSYDVPDFYRGILTARVSVNGKPFYVIVNHWKSRFGGGEQQRMNCSNRVVQLVNELIPELEGHSDVPIIIGGDFNDNDSDLSVRNLEQHGLVNTLKTLPTADRWTLPYFDREKSEVELDSFDHIFINDACRSKNSFKWILSKVVRPKRMLSTRTFDGIKHVWPDDDNQSHIGYSDHFPVVAKFEIDKKE